VRREDNETSSTSLDGSFAAARLRIAPASGHIHVIAETTLGQAVITIQGAYCPREEVIVFGVCTDPAAENRLCAVQATLHIDPPQ
jgi:hypothetical protein